MAMVDYVLENHDGDPNRIFAVGASSGACMTLALMATHPDVFSGGSVLAGVPYGAWKTGGTCAVCNTSATAQSEDAWGNIVRQNAPANFNGPWPRIQLWHGTADTTLNSGWLAESEKQWKNVHGVTGAGTSATGPAGWTRTEYSAEGAIVLQVNSGAGKDHYLPDDVPQAEIVKFFGLDVDAAPGGDTSGVETSGSAPPVGTSAEEDSSSTEPGTTTDTTTSTTTTSASSTSETTTPAPTTTGPTTTPTTSTPVTPPVTPTSTPPAGSTSAPSGTDTSTSTGTETATAPVQTDTSSDEGCQCQLGAAGQSTGALAGLIAAGIATLLRRRRR
jgi:acetylxylan esterase